MFDYAWSENPIGEITIAIKDGSHGTHKRVVNGVPLLSAKNVTDRGLLEWDDTDDQISEEDYAIITTSYNPLRDDLLLTIVGTLGRRALFDGSRVAFQRSVAFIRSDQKQLNPRYLFHAVASNGYSRQLIQRSNATAQAGLYLNELVKTTIPLPPLVEQFHIAAVLDTVDEAIAKTEAVIAKLKQVRAGLLHDLLTRGLDENGQLRDPITHPEQFQDSPIGRIPREWRIAPLREVADIASGVTLGRNLTGAGTLELPYLRVANVQDGYLDLADVKTVRIFSSELERFQLKCGDVLMNEGGDYDKLGRGTVWENQIPVCLHQNHVFRVRCRFDVLNCYFLAAVSGSETGKRYFLRSSKQSTNLASINSTQLNAFEVPVPNLAEQTAIIRILAVQDDQLKVETIGLTKLRAMKSALMTDLLTGRVRVPASL